MSGRAQDLSVVGNFYIADFSRLVQVKQSDDPDNAFRFLQSIPLNL
ncbi:hypothetical protein C2W62_04295 [Candidatus Entotheonella serta]|nr:hypothetical protein C2W62_04295 [Candidatus Entotheonella serta]